MDDTDDPEARAGEGGVLRLPAPLPLDGGGALPRVDVAYRTWGGWTRRGPTPCSSAMR